MKKNCIRCHSPYEIHGPFHDNGEIFRAYLAGPMAGVPDFEQTFAEAAFYLRTVRYWTLTNPAELGELPEYDTHYLRGPGRAAYLKRDFEYLVASDAIVLLPDWHQSTGANVELAVARATNMSVYEYVREHHENHIWRSTAMPSLAIVGRHLAEVTDDESWLIEEFGRQR